MELRPPHNPPLAFASCFHPQTCATSSENVERARSGSPRNHDRACGTSYFGWLQTGRRFPRAATPEHGSPPPPVHSDRQRRSRARVHGRHGLQPAAVPQREGHAPTRKLDCGEAAAPRGGGWFRGWWRWWRKRWPWESSFPRNEGVRCWRRCACCFARSHCGSFVGCCAFCSCSAQRCAGAAFFSRCTRWRRCRAAGCEPDSRRRLVAAGCWRRICSSCCCAAAAGWACARCRHRS